MNRRHRVVALGALLALVVLGSVLAALASASDEARRPTVKLRLDGEVIRPELAMTVEERATGLMHRKRAPKDGMLFVFSRPAHGGFWMKNTLVPLKIVFFNVNGKRVRTMWMTPCKRNPCRVYNPKRSYRFALELPASDRRPAKKLGPLQDLRRLVDKAS